MPKNLTEKNAGRYFYYDNLIIVIDRFGELPEDAPVTSAAGYMREA